MQTQLAYRRMETPKSDQIRILTLSLVSLRTLGKDAKSWCLSFYIHKVG